MALTPQPAPARVCRWFGGKQAAISIRFDDSHPTHIEVAFPRLDEFGLIGTFFVNPGNDAYRKYQSVWEGAVIAHGHELADHTLNHHGAQTDAEADTQIGAPAELIRRLQPDRKLISMIGGGSVLWQQRKPFAFYTAKYHLWDTEDPIHPHPNLLSCSEVRPTFSAELFTRHLDKALADGDWFQPYFHQLDTTGHLRVTPPVFRRLLEIVASHQTELWSAGMAAIYQYRKEQENAAVWPQAEGDDVVRLDLTCGTDANLFDQPLTLEVDLPAATTAATVADAAGAAITSRIEDAGGRRVLRFEAPPVDARFTIRVTGLGASVRPQVTAVKAPGAHPFVVFTPAELGALKARNGDPLAKGMWERALAHGDELLGRDPSKESRSEGPWPRMGEELSPIEALSFAYALTGNQAYAAAVAPRLEALTQEDWWHEKNSEMLITAEAINTMGLAYDWTHDALPEALRAKIRAAMINHGLRPIAEEAAKGAWWTDWYHCNWGAVIFSQAGIAALSLLGDEPEAAAWVRLCERKIWHYTHSLNEDGSWGEGVTYGAFAWSNSLLFAHSVRRFTGRDLFDNNRVRQLPQWFMGLLDPSHRSYVPFSNCWNGSSNAIVGPLFCLAHEYRDGVAQSVARELSRGRGGDLLAFVTYDPTVEAKPLSTLPLDTLFRDLDWAFLRSSREDPNATVFGLKGGHKEWDHSHHDTNSFVLYAYGKPLFVDLFYPHHLWGVKTEAHNTIMVDGKEQAGGVNVAGGRDSVDHRGLISDLVDGPWYARLVGDASLAYDPTNVSSFVREVMYLRHAAASDPADYFVLFDDVVTPNPARPDWMLHTYGEAKFAHNLLTVTQNEAAVDVTMVSPQGLGFEQSEKNLADINTPTPFAGATAVKTLKLRPAQAAGRTFFLSILAPRPADAPAPLTITAVQAANTLGADIAAGANRDRALFALDAPTMAGAGLEAKGRSCFVRTAGGQVRGAALHNGQRLAADGLLLFETNSSGSALLTFTETGVEVKLDLYDSDEISLHVDRAPKQVTVNGKDQPFDYNAAAQTIRVKFWAAREMQIVY